MPFSIYLLAICQALLMSNSSLLIAASALIGYALADDKSLATLPLSLQFLAMMLTSIPASLLMGKIGRRAGFSIASLIGITAGSLALYSIFHHNFWLFTLAAMGIGIFNGFGNYFRFAAVEVSGDEVNHAKAISYVMAGGVIAAFIGPNMANFGRSIFPAEEFAGGFIFVIAFYCLILLIMAFIKLPLTTLTNQQPGRTLREIINQPKFIVAVICGMLGYGVMSYVMTATPLAMKHHHHDFDQTAFVIQWHVLAMFAPSFFTGDLIKKFGVLTIMLIGAIFALLCVVINLTGTSVWHFWTALLLLGISWNFLFIGATTLLTETYQPHEKAKVQAANDFMVFTAVTLASLSAGIFQHHYGWEMVNIGSLPFIVIIMVSIIWLRYRSSQSKVTKP